jgi:hypothetical protein
MKIQNLFESHGKLVVQQIEWFKKYIDAFIYKYGDQANVGVDFYTVPDGKIETSRNFVIVSNYYQDQDPLPKNIRFGHIRIMTFSDCQLENFDILPTTAQSVTFKEDTEILSGSLKGISKTLKQCKRIEFPKSVKSGLLEAFKIEGMQELHCNGNKNSKKQSAIEIAVGIVNQHLKEGKDIFDCQEALHARRFGEFC